MLDRIKFWMFGPIWGYRAQTGTGARREAYNPFTDTCRVRWSYNGYVTGTGPLSRKDYLEFLESCDEG